MGLGIRLNLIRTKRGMSLKDMSKIFGLTPAALSRYENEERTPDIDFIAEFGRNFNVNGDWLLYGDKPIFKSGERIQLNEEEKLIDLLESIKEPTKIEKNISTCSLEEISKETPYNYINLLRYMKKYPIIRKNIFQFFYLFQMPEVDQIE